MKSHQNFASIKVMKELSSGQCVDGVCFRDGIHLSDDSGGARSFKLSADQGDAQGKWGMCLLVRKVIGCDIDIDQMKMAIRKNRQSLDG
jgi:hypothetical protein